MTKLNKEDKIKIAAIANSEGWPLGTIANTFVMITEQVIKVAPEDRDR
jgi:hypothetical protein